MNEIKFNKNSWHYWLATQVNYDPHVCNRDICTYLRYVLGGMLLIAFAVFLVSWALFFIADALAWVTACLVFWAWIDIGMGGVVLIAAAAALTVWGLWKIAEISATQTARSQFAQEAWRSIHDKACFPIKFE